MCLYMVVEVFAIDRLSLVCSAGGTRRGNNVPKLFYENGYDPGTSGYLHCRCTVQETELAEKFTMSLTSGDYPTESPGYVLQNNAHHLPDEVPLI